jgi:hypothetical protein
MSLLVVMAACAPSAIDGPYVDHEEASDFDDVGAGGAELKADGPAASFAPSDVMSDAFFTDVDYIDADGLQAFFERSPYGQSWLAGATVGGRRAADAIVDASRAKGINPLVMVARMQVEASLVSPASRPAQWKIDQAFGCGCPDGAACAPQYKGLDKQVACAADTLRRWYDASARGNGIFNKGRGKRSLDGYLIVPANHATASLYAYTPWVLVGSGGNWLVWNVTRRFAVHAEARGQAGGGGASSAPARPIEVYWARTASGAYDLRALAAADVVKVEYLVDGYPIGSATRAAGANFPASYTFSTEGTGRRFEVKGYDAQGRFIALGNGSIDVTAGTAVFVRQLGTGFYDIGLERAPAGVAAIEVSADGYPLTDEVSGSRRSTRLTVRSHFGTLGSRQLAITTVGADGSVRGTLRRTVTLR